MWNLFKSKKFKHRILSIDGGGLKGYFAIYTIYRLHEDYEIDVRDHFDTFAGTSTGSIIAAALATGIDYKTILDLYRDGEKNIFIKNGMIKRMNTEFYPKYTNDGLKNYVKKFFANYDFDDAWHMSKKGLLIFSTDLSDQKGAIFATPNFTKTKAVESSKAMIEDALIASTAAPTFFPIFKYKDSKDKKSSTRLLVDGSLWANDPSLMTHSLVKQQYNLQDEEIKLLSLGYTRKSNAYIDAKKVGKSVEEDSLKKDASIGNLMGTTLGLNAFVNNIVLNIDMSKNNYKRVDMPSDKTFDMDKLTDEFIKLAETTYEKNKEGIKNFILNSKR